MENVSKRDILVNYLKLCNKDDMAEAMMKYCDEDRGIVFNRHPARNEKKFGAIYDYSASSQSKISSATSSSHDLKGSIEKGINQSNRSRQSIVQSKCFYKSKSSLESLQIDKHPSSYIPSSRKQKVQDIVVQRNDPISDVLDDMCEIVAPEGKGKFLKFIGENYVYVLLENGTYNCYPMDLLKLNRSYLKTNAMYNIRLNYKDRALNHTRNVLKGKNASLQRKETPLNEQRGFSNEFVAFPAHANHLRDYIVKNDLEEENIPLRNYLENHLESHVMRLPLNNYESGGDEPDRSHVTGHHNLAKKIVKIRSLNSRYTLEGSTWNAPMYLKIAGEESSTPCC
ncbi:conserved Plasmodium protein, unknown function [Plasmodium knowlesi strain H]|uniref:Uncharacterized protein n=3 Tax=Plasmodium knowlesi TaxID=5850 RepID=A0A5K1VN76_PLAKH|nr:conserved Plasmodium protein, unknown function [Plasmodium knowlesi strain H]OTN66782.1 Uncharacterized protein PKNOH_S08487400 [Plasmodium knowlesi]CAA9986853.1 conserved Plasmodium protein, unknown function [Plasmodium knowlesi strain H]SBO23699.1 conserved Plasmodium protein, unknown function [Plasmodium knowlesi strain H]SBO25325.1 conserved Plasmodium protein, unknown function [Plasmodium knowlesi strain H]VVS76327.1 conserved Plasmodium protein, unknown function [Plasmodium knowlesi s|eukprot:XP_002260663.1 hypothetical protein, conserved in Plasmodium species [Plasmodium knowlesi strain H]